MPRPWPGYVMQVDGPDNVVDDVKLVQSKIGVWQEGIYGQTTAENVSKYQRANGIGPTAQVGQQTWDSLFNNPPPAPPTAPLLGPDALSWAKGEGLSGPNTMGVLEDPIGSNWGDRVSQYLKSAGFTTPAAWCVVFVYWAFEQAAKGKGVKNPMLKTGSSSGLYNWARDNGKLVSAPQPGDIALVIGGDTGHYHCLLVASAIDQNSRFQTVEGNSNTDGSANGIGVVWRSPGRPIASCDFIRL